MLSNLAISTDKKRCALINPALYSFNSVCFNILNNCFGAFFLQILKNNKFINKNKRILITLKKKINCQISANGIYTQHEPNDWTNLFLSTNSATFTIAQPSSCWCKMKYPLRLMRM